VPENVGLCARVLKNTGFSQLVLVDHKPTQKSFEVAKRARDILRDATLSDALEGAIANTHFVLATTRRARAYRHSHNFIDLIPSVVALASKKKVGILFGSENFGLSKQDLTSCDSVCFLEAADNFPSYNLSHAVTIVCFELAHYIKKLHHNFSLPLAKKGDIASMYSFIIHSLHELGFSQKASLTMLESLKRLFARTHLTKNEVQLMKSIFLAVQKRRGDKKKRPGYKK